ncbi:gfo/Idh/MocA family oxidoreductase [Candidatus Poribacteria bacterium]|nr:MAG: gfo/Idh/MocA family oxidoreductase [Candidatus Poribacteria bacterium]
MLEEVRVGFLGAGGNARGHMERVSKIEGVRIVAVCDIDESRARQAAEAYNAKWFTDYRRMIDEVEMDALYVSVPPFAHYDAEIRAAEKKIHLFVEKPVALTLERGLEIWEAIEKNGVISCVGYQLRYGPYADNIKEFLQGKNIAMAVAERWGGMILEKKWWHMMERSGGQLVEQTTHQVDLLRYWVGEVREVYARYGLQVHKHTPGVTIPDLQLVMLQFANGALGYVVSSCTNIPGRSGYDIYLEGMRLEFRGREPKLYPEGAAEIDLTPRKGPSIDEAFINAVKTGDPSGIKSPYIDALKTLDVTLAANRSAKENRPVPTYFSW